MLPPEYGEGPLLIRAAGPADDQRRPALSPSLTIAHGTSRHGWIRVCAVGSSPLPTETRRVQFALSASPEQLSPGRQLALPFAAAIDDLPLRLRVHLTEDPEHGCWLGSPTDRDGYGRLGGRRMARLVWQELKGEIGAGLVLDHWRLDLGLPCSRSCCRPDHLEPIANLLNLRKSPRANASKVRCDSGHEFTPANTYWRPHGAGRDCRACVRARVAKYQRRLRAERSAAESSLELRSAA